MHLWTAYATILIGINDARPDMTNACGGCGSDGEFKSSAEMVPELTLHCVVSCDNEEILKYPRQKPGTAADCAARNVFI